jgi:hypothetical protein
MLEHARDGSWLTSIDTILSKMVLRIASLWELHKSKSGVIEKVVAKVSKRWENCLSFRIVEQRGSGRMFTVFRTSERNPENTTCYTIDILDKRCDCGEWQLYGIPCVDAVAYYRVKKNMLLQEILELYVDKHYTYEHEKQLLKNNIIPVCMDRISFDGTTMPPVQHRRSAGRPKKIRIRNRSRWAHEPEKSNIVCSRCHVSGHNIRTCLAREALARQNEEEGGTRERGQNQLDLS